LYNRGAFEEAMEHYKEALEIQPTYVEAQNNLGNVLAKLGRIDEAITHFQVALALKPEYAEAENNLGHAIALQGNLEEAIIHFRRALEIRPDFAEAHCHLGIALARQGRVEESVTNYKKALEIDPDYVEALNNLAWLRATWPDASYRDGTEAVELAQRVVTITGGQQPELLDTLAAAYAEAGRFENAVTTARWAMELAARQQKRTLVKTLRARLGLYEAGSAFRENHP